MQAQIQIPPSTRIQIHAKYTHTHTHKIDTNTHTHRLNKNGCKHTHTHTHMHPTLHAPRLCCGLGRGCWICYVSLCAAEKFEQYCEELVTTAAWGGHLEVRLAQGKGKRTSAFLRAHSPVHLVPWRPKGKSWGSGSGWNTGFVPLSLPVSVCLSVPLCPFACLFVLCLSVYLSVCLSICPSLPICPSRSVCPSFHLCLFVPLSVCLFVPLSLSVFVPLCLFVPLWLSVCSSISVSPLHPSLVHPSSQVVVQCFIPYSPYWQ